MRDIKCPVFVEEVLSGPGLPILPTRYDKRNVVILNVLQQGKDLFKSERALCLLKDLFRNYEMPLSVTNSACASSPGEVGADACPSLLEDGLHLLQPVQC